MKFFKPQVQLARQTILDEPDAYYLHVVTFCPRTSFRADGYSVSDADLAEGIFTVTVKLLQDPELPDFDYITPVVHTLALGGIAFPGGEGWIEVQVMGAVPGGAAAGGRGEPATTTKTGGKGTVSTTDADNKSKPIRNDEL
ncbi:MAG: hypothetical protein ACKVT2_12430 [Saprospiraceae bacterium]